MTHLNQVLTLMKDGVERTAAEISTQTGIAVKTVTSRLRELRELGHTVSLRHLGNKVYGYTVSVVEDVKKEL